MSHTNDVLINIPVRHSVPILIISHFLRLKIPQHSYNLNYLPLIGSTIAFRNQRVNTVEACEVKLT
jgi:hypothetical protein